jgi:DNA-binding transcriptional regulator YdaS (Cro superfamily)
MNAIKRPPRILSHWKRQKPEKKGARLGKLSPIEQAHARNALRHTRAQYGSSEALAEALGVSRTTVAQSASSYTVSPELVLRLANLTGVTITAILTGEWPTPRRCPTCGQSWEP